MSDPAEAITPIPYTNAVAHDTLFPIIVAQFFSFALFGVSSLQFYYCYKLLLQSTGKELKNFIVLTGFFVLDFADQVSKGQWFWKTIEAAVTIGLASAFVPSDRSSYALTVLSGFLVPRACHFYYMARIFRISANWKYRALVRAMLFVCFIITMVAGVFALLTGRIGLRKPIDFEPDIKVLPIPWLAGDAFVDIALSLILVIYLRAQKTDFDDTNQLITKWIFLTLESGIFSAAGAIADLILAVVFPLKPYHFAVNLNLSKIYLNSILVLFHTVTRNRVKGATLTGSHPTSSNPRYLHSTRGTGIMVTSQVDTHHDGSLGVAPQVVSLHSKPVYQPKTHLDEESSHYPEKDATHYQS